VEWEILLTPEVEAFLDELYESDRASHQLVNQAILVLERNGPGEGRCGRRQPGGVRFGSCWSSIRGGRRSCS
jgi:hypothetical protein